MRVLSSTYDARGDVEPLVGLAVRERELGAQVQMCAPRDRAERPAEIDVPLLASGLVRAVAAARSVAPKLLLDA